MKEKKKIVVLTGAGISAESGIKTFRGAGGLWEGHDIMEVASPDGWRRNPELVLEFYNIRRKQLAEVQPNLAHTSLVRLEEKYIVKIITQNVDDLHERAGSKNVLHLHGELKKVRSQVDPSIIVDIGYGELKLGDLCPRDSQLRPHIVWFGEMVPLIEDAADECVTADIFIVIGTSMVVYPAAGLISYVSGNVPKYIIDPEKPAIHSEYSNLNFIVEKGSTGTKSLVDKLLSEA